MKIEKLDNYGRGITYYEDTITFVENALVGEDILLDNIINKKNYKEATIKKILSESQERIVPKCPYYNTCGGCNLMHMNYDYQEQFKIEKVQHILKKYAGIETSIKLIKNDKQLFYRNKVSLKIENYKWGFYSNKTHNLIEIKNCLISANELNEIINNHDFLNIENGLIDIRTNYNKEILISIKTESKVILNEDIPSSVIGIVVNDETIYGKSFFYDYIGDFKFKISYNSFFQVNNYMASQIFNILKNNLSGENLLDLYCGVGTLGISVASNFANIYGIEKIDNAIIDAKENALNNNILNAYFYAGDTGSVLKNINTKFDTIIVDPPRSGLNNETMSQILNLAPQTLAYISCDPITLARDLKVLKNIYNIKKINILEMFPNTYHVETVCLLIRK